MRREGGVSDGECGDLGTIEGLALLPCLCVPKLIASLSLESQHTETLRALWQG